MSRRYIDMYEQVWERIGDYYVWKPDTGYGLWDKGKGLKQL